MDVFNQTRVQCGTILLIVVNISQLALRSNINDFQNYTSHKVQLLILDNFYASECICKNGSNCDGAAFIERDPRLCVAYMKANAPQEAVVSIIKLPV